MSVLEMSRIRLGSGACQKRALVLVEELHKELRNFNRANLLKKFQNSLILGMSTVYDLDRDTLSSLKELDDTVVIQVYSPLSESTSEEKDRVLELVPTCVMVPLFLVH